MEPGPLLYALLSQAAPVVALLAAPDRNVKIYPVQAPQGTARPYLNYQLISGGPQEGSSAICRLGDVARVQLSLFADSYEAIVALTAAVRGVLDYAEPEPGVYLTLENVLDQPPVEGALCLFRSLDYSVELP